MQEASCGAPARAHGPLHSGIGYSEPPIIPRDEELRRAAELLNAASKVAILLGAGAVCATGAVVAVAEKLGAGEAKALLDKQGSPWGTGSIGLLGTKPSFELTAGCDTFLMVRSGFPYSEFLPKEGQARGVQLDLEPEMLSLRYPMEVNHAGDAAETLRALWPMLENKTDRQPTISISSRPFRLHTDDACHSRAA